MNLIIDIGNTRAKIAVFKKDTLVMNEVIGNTILLKRITTILKEYKIRHSIISSVAKLSKKLTSLLSEKMKAIVLSSETRIPFKNLYKTPKTLGVDRIALVANSVSRYPKKNVLVIDAGTCITYDFVNSKKEYYGGAIAPGLKMRYNALHQFTENLPLLEHEIKSDFKASIGNSTKNAIHQGVINGVILEIEGIIKQHQNKYNNLTIVLTGGDTFFLAKLLKSSIFANPNFLLEGLNHILNYNLQND